MAQKTTPQEKSKPVAESFEKGIEELEKTVHKLEGGELDLESSIKEFEKGLELFKFCQSRLNEIERKVEILLKSNEKGAETEEFKS